MIEWVSLAFLMVVAWYDYKYMRIPNKLQIVAFVTVWVLILITEPQSSMWRLKIALAMTTLFFLMFIIGKGGGGDLKLMLWFGAGFGLDAIVSLLISIFVMFLWLIGYIIVKRKKVQEIPLGPFLAIGAFLWIFSTKFIFEISFTPTIS